MPQGHHPECPCFQCDVKFEKTVKKIYKKEKNRLGKSEKK